MYIVKAARWHFVEVLPSATRTPTRRCSVCASTDLRPSGQTALDAVANRRYGIVRCQGCGYDLLEPAVTTVAAAS
jgi:ribosomal protein S27E